MLSLESIHVGAEYILLVLISLRKNDFEVDRSSNNYSTPILNDLMREDHRRYLVTYGQLLCKEISDANIRTRVVQAKQVAFSCGLSTIWNLIPRSIAFSNF